MNVASPPSGSAIYKHFIRGSVWAVLMRWSLRGIGLVSTIILARVLTPEDFGVVAMAAVAFGLLERFSELGAGTLLIREANITRADCDTAWTIHILQGLFVALALVVIAPYASRYFTEPRLMAVIHVAAARALIGGTSNIGLVLLRKELDFARDFRFHVYGRLLRFAVTVPLALALRTYWALVIGGFVGTVLSVLLSYRMHPYRPGLSLSRAREFVDFSLAIVPFNIGRFLNNRADILVVGRIAATSSLGIYSVAAELPNMITQQIRASIERGLIPNYAKLTHDREKLVEAFIHVLTSVSIITVPLGLGLFSVGEDFVSIVLGDQWGESVPILRWLAIYGVLASLGGMMTGNILIVSGHERLSAVVMWIRLGFLLPSVVVAGVYWGVPQVAVGATAAATFMLPVAAYSLTTVLPVTLGKLARALWRPAVAGVIMVVVVQSLHVNTIELPAVTLTLDIITGAIAYAAALIGLWWLSGRPAGPERVVITSVASRLGWTLAG